MRLPDGPGPGPDPERAALDARLLAWMREPAAPERWAADDARFETLALDLFAFQFAHCAPYRRWCEERGRTPGTVSHWRQIPAVPTGAFKEVELRSFSKDRLRHVFRTSGTSAARRGELLLDTLNLYEASLVPTFRVHVLPDLVDGERIRLRVLTPPPAESPDSSLSHMFGTLLPIFGATGSGFDVHGHGFDPAALLGALRAAAQSDEPVALCGTSFAFVHLVDALAERRETVALPAGSRIMETGGFKGRSREVSRDELYEEIASRLGVPPTRIVNQYGMTELGSQFYDTVLRHPGTTRRKLGPPWARVRIVDPVSGEDVPEGEPGMIVVIDLANSGSVLAVATADLGRRVGDGFEVLGRVRGAETRGCSIAADTMLGDRVSSAAGVGATGEAPPAQQITAALRRLRATAERLRQRHPREVIDVLGVVLESFRSRETPARLRLEAELPEAAGFSPEVVRAGLDLALESWDAGALRRLVEAELGLPGASLVGGHDVTAVVLGGALPTPTLLSLIAPLALRSPVLAKTAQHDPVTARAFARALHAADPDLAAALEVVSFPGDDAARMRALTAADCVVATGSDETIAALASAVLPPRRFVGYGHRVSIAVLGPEAIRGPALAAAARGLALDVALWDQLGCLSPVSIFVLGDAREAAETIAAELEAIAERLPRGRMSRGARTAFANAQAEAQMRADSGRSVIVRCGASSVVVCEADAEPRPAPLHRFLRVHPIAGDAALREALRPLAPYLAGVALAGFGADGPAACAALAAMGASRICAPGRLQAPPLDWHHDGQSVLRPLARFTDVEIG